MCTRLNFRQDVFADADAAAAYDLFLREVFGVAPHRRSDANPAWEPFVLLDAEGRCLAGVEAALLQIVADGEAVYAAAIRLAGVAVAHRGRGLFREAMTLALARCAARCDGPLLLYTEEPALYTRFGFRTLAQHAFVGAAPEPAWGEPAQILDTAEAERLVDRLAPTRTPVSNACAILGGRDLLRANLRDEPGLIAAHAADLDALIVHEVEDDVLVVVDVVAASMPTMAQIVGALRSPCPRVRALFPPDRLAWRGAPELDDTGLMVRGAVPAAMTRPFMLPPTTAF